MAVLERQPPYPKGGPPAGIQPEVRPLREDLVLGCQLQFTREERDSLGALGLLDKATLLTFGFDPIIFYFLFINF